MRGGRVVGADGPDEMVRSDYRKTRRLRGCDGQLVVIAPTLRIADHDIRSP
jgi:hypothetical protein